MKKTIYGIVVAVLGAVLGAGAMYMFGLGKPAATAPGSAPTVAAPASAPAPAKTGEGAASTPPTAPNASAATANKGAGGGRGSRRWRHARRIGQAGKTQLAENRDCGGQLALR